MVGTSIGMPLGLFNGICEGTVVDIKVGGLDGIVGKVDWAVLGMCNGFFEGLYDRRYEGSLKGESDSSFVGA